MNRWILLLFLLLPQTLIAAEEFWERKDYRLWTEKECRKLLQDSPWTRKYTWARPVVELIEPGQTASIERVREPNPEISYNARILSALPIRQALVRLTQLARKYDAMSPEERLKFDAEAERFLTALFPDTIVISVTYGSNVAAYDQDLARYWQTQTAETLKNTVFLLAPEGSLVLSFYDAERGDGRSFQFVFPRPRLEPDDRSLKFEFLHPNIREEGEQRVLLEFPVKRMVVAGAVVY